MILMLSYRFMICECELTEKSFSLNTCLAKLFVKRSSDQSNLVPFIHQAFKSFQSAQEYVLKIYV